MHVLVLAGALAGALLAVDAPQQAERFTISATTANVREQPTTKSRVVGQLPRGAALEVIGHKGGWVELRIVGADGTERRGYVLGTLGVLEVVQPVDTAQVDQPVAVSSSAPSSQLPQAAARPEASPVPDPGETRAYTADAVNRQVQSFRSEPRAKTLGLGARMGGFTFGVGASGRVWTQGRFGFQGEISRYSLGASDPFWGSSSVNFSVTQFGASVLYAFPSEEPDESMWIRPYAGGGLNVFRTALSSSFVGFGINESASDSATDVGFQVLGGAEAVFKRWPVAVSADLGYYSTGLPFAGVSIGGFAYGLSLHWYVK